MHVTDTRGRTIRTAMSAVGLMLLIAGCDAASAGEAALVDQSQAESQSLMSISPEEEELIDAPAKEEMAAKACVGLHGPCAGNPGACCGALECIGADNHQKCECSARKTFTARYDSKRLSGLPGCREDGNPGGVGHTVTYLRGCGDALLADVCGHGKAVPAFVMSKSADVACGPPMCR